MKKGKVMYCFYGVMIILMIVMMVVAAKEDSEKYPSLHDYKGRFTGVVKEKAMGQAGSMAVLFCDKKVFYIGHLYESDTVKEEQLKLKEWEQNSLNSFLQYGDSVSKPKDSDTVFVYRKGIEYIFIDRYHR